MIWLDWIPTVPEVINFTLCRLAGHDWDGLEKCRVCGKVKE